MYAAFQKIQSSEGEVEADYIRTAEEKKDDQRIQTDFSVHVGINQIKEADTDNGPENLENIPCGDAEEFPDESGGKPESEVIDQTSALVSDWPIITYQHFINCIPTVVVGVLIDDFSDPGKKNHNADKEKNNYEFWNPGFFKGLRVKRNLIRIGAETEKDPKKQNAGWDR